MCIGKRIKKRRKELGLTQAQLAEKAGIIQQSLQKIEDGTTRNPRNVEALANALQSTPEYLLFGRVESESKNQIEYGEKIRLLRIKNNFTQDEFAEKLDISPSTLNEIEHGHSVLGLSVIEKILRDPDFNYLSDWFFYSGVSGVPDKKSYEFAESWHSYINENHSENLESNVVPGPIIKSTVPLISWVQAGAWSEINEVREYDAERYMCPVNSSDKTFALKVQGVSMEPKFFDGDLIFVDPEAECIHGSYVVARLDDNNEATFKQLIIESGQKFLKAANPNWPEQLIPINGNCTLVGKVVFAGKSF